MKSRIRTKIFNIALSILSTLAALPAPGQAAVPELINFQGKLTDSAGKAITSAVPMVFKFYTGPSGGAPVWTETQNVTPDNYGVYSVLLGGSTPFNTSFSIPYWLGVAVGSDSEMLPRYRMVSSAYSLYSATAAWAAGADWPAITNKPSLTSQGNVFNGANQLVQLLVDGKLPVLDGSNLTGVPSAGLADGSVTTAKLGPNAVTDEKVLLSTAAISSGKFGDERIAVSTYAISGGVYNTAGKLVQMGADSKLPALDGSNLINLTKTQLGLGNVNDTSDAAKPVSAAQQTALDLKANLAGATFSGALAASNLSGANTGDQTAISGNAGTATKLAVARAINGVNFDGSADITITASVNYADDTTNVAAMYPVWTTAPGNNAAWVSTTKLIFVPNTGILTATGFSGGLTGNVLGNVTGNLTGNADTATSAVSAGKAANLSGGAAGRLPYQSGLDTTAMLAAGLAGEILQSNGAGAPVWAAAASANTANAIVRRDGAGNFSAGAITASDAVTGKGFINTSQSVVLDGAVITTFAANGSGVVLLRQKSGTNPIATITGCDSGAVGQGQIVTFVVAIWDDGGLSFTDTTIVAGTADIMLLNGATPSWDPGAAATSLGSTITLLCTTISSKKVWVELGRSLSSI